MDEKIVVTLRDGTVLEFGGDGLRFDFFGPFLAIKVHNKATWIPTSDIQFVSRSWELFYPTQDYPPS